jgi:hypothetical protein
MTSTCPAGHENVWAERLKERSEKRIIRNSFIEMLRRELPSRFLVTLEPWPERQVAVV